MKRTKKMIFLVLAISFAFGCYRLYEFRAKENQPLEKVHAICECFGEINDAYAKYDYNAIRNSAIKARNLCEDMVGMEYPDTAKESFEEFRQLARAAAICFYNYVENKDSTQKDVGVEKANEALSKVSDIYDDLGIKTK